MPSRPLRPALELSSADDSSSSEPDTESGHLLRPRSSPSLSVRSHSSYNHAHLYAPPPGCASASGVASPAMSRQTSIESSVTDALYFRSGQVTPVASRPGSPSRRKRKWFSNGGAPEPRGRLSSSSSSGSLSGLAAGEGGSLLARKKRRGPVARMRRRMGRAWDWFTTRPYVPTQAWTIILSAVLVGLFIFSVVQLIIYILNPDKTPLPWRTYCQDAAPFPHELADSLPPLAVLVGIMSVDRAVERRMVIRETWARGAGPTDGRNVQVRFVLGQPSRKLAREIMLEQEAFGDLIVLNTTENMNGGKTYAYFSWAAENASVPDPASPADKKTWRKPDFVVKADDDSFIMLGELERHLRVQPKEMTYWGYLVKNRFMAGEAYALSRDLVDYVAGSPVVRQLTRGAEDKQTAKWMRHHPRADEVKWASERCWIYNHPKSPTVYSHGFLFPSEVSRVRTEGDLGLSRHESLRRGGEERMQAYSTVTKWGRKYVPPREGMSLRDEVAALVEGAEESLRDDEKAQGAKGSPRESLAERMENRPWGGTVVVHFLKRHEWFYETAIALLADWGVHNWRSTLDPAPLDSSPELEPHPPPASSSSSSASHAPSSSSPSATSPTITLPDSPASFSSASSAPSTYPTSSAHASAASSTPSEPQPTPSSAPQMLALHAKQFDRVTL